MTETLDIQSLGPATIAWTETFRLRSECVDQDFLIEVAWPPVAPAKGQRFGVVYVLDGNPAFGLTAAAVRSIQSGPFPLPPTLVVGIGYHFEKPEDRSRWGVLRVRDFTPCPDAIMEAHYGSVAAAVAGGAADFAAFIETELKPFIAARFPVDTSDQTLIGSSLGGFYCLHTLMTAPQTFQRYVAISPALYWGDGRLFALEHEQAGCGAPLNARVFLGVGGLEESHSAAQRLVSNVYAFEARLRERRDESLALEARVFEGETHMSVYAGAATRGLGFVFGGYRDMSDWQRWLREAREA